MSGRDPLSGVTPVTADGAVYPLATIDYYVVGTTTRENTYTTAALTTPNTNPVVLGSDGRIPEIFFSQTRMKRVFKDSSGNTIPGLSWDGIDKTKQRVYSEAAPSPTYPDLEWVQISTQILFERNQANSGWNSRGNVDSSINASTVTQALTGTDTSTSMTPDSTAALWQRGTDIASASTLSLPSTGGSWFNITGTTGCTAISSAQGGRTVRLKFAGACILTHSASFILLEAVNELTIANAVYEFTNEAAADATGSTWRCTQRWLPGTRTTPAAKGTGGYTVLDTDRGAYIRFSSLAGDPTLALPAATNRNGFELFIGNEDTDEPNGFGVIVDPSGAELIDGFATRKLYTGTRVQIRCDGTGWRTISGKYRYFSGNQSITAGGTLTLAHNLGVRPRNTWGELRCTTAEGNYSIGDIIQAKVGGDSDSATMNGWTSVIDSTNLTVRFGTLAGVFVIPNKTTGAPFTITPANWRFRAWAEE